MKTKKTVSLLRRAIVTNMSLPEIKRLKRLIACIIQFHRLKFGDAIPQEYQDIFLAVELLIPSEMRQETYVQYEISCRPSLDELGDIITGFLATAIRRSVSSTVKEELNKIIATKLYEPTDLSDVSWTDSAESPPQQVPDNDEPQAEKARI